MKMRSTKISSYQSHHIYTSKAGKLNIWFKMNNWEYGGIKLDWRCSKFSVLYPVSNNTPVGYLYRHYRYKHVYINTTFGAAFSPNLICKLNSGNICEFKHPRIHLAPLALICLSPQLHNSSGSGQSRGSMSFTARNTYYKRTPENQGMLLHTYKYEDNDEDLTFVIG